MLKYIGKRILLFVPTLFIITLLGFVIAINAPGDPVEKMMTSATGNGDISSQHSSLNEQKKIWRKKLGLDLPVFYFTVSSVASPDTLFKIQNQDQRTSLERLLNQYGNWIEISNYFRGTEKLYSLLIKLKPDSSFVKSGSYEQMQDQLTILTMEANTLRSSFANEVTVAKFANINTALSQNNFPDAIRKQFTDLQADYSTMKLNASVWKNYIPSFNFYGLNNQYHRWLFGDGEFSKGLVRMDFGISYSSKLPVNEILKTKIGWSLFFTILSVLLAYLISVPLGVKAAETRGSIFDRGSSLMLFALYSLPTFFVAFLLMLLLANPHFISVLPASGVKPAEGYPDGAGFWECVKISLPYIIMPLICYTYGSFAFLSRTMRSAMIDTIGQDYIRTARAKGLPEKKVIWKHALRNSLLPLITVFASVFPAAIGGSVILESIFTIPGMGLEVFNAIAGQDYPMIIAVMTLTGILTLIGFLISDILYAVVDPRISYR